ncbi:MAG: pyridoxamine 5'-phosphate oxidase family protein [Acidimicrobiia bacterium]
MADAGAMTRDEREAFLADVHVGMLAIDEPGRGPLNLPIWYLYRDGVVLISIGSETLKARLLRAAGRATMTVQTETAPYQYVSVEGPVTLTTGSPDQPETAVRYLGPELGTWYVENTTDGDTVTIALTPEHWRTHDFSKSL